MLVILPLFHKTGQYTWGYVYPYVTTHDLVKLDQYEGDLYNRLVVDINTTDNINMRAWTYVLKQEYSHLLSDDAWNRRIFCNRSMSTYISVL